MKTFFNLLFLLFSTSASAQYVFLKAGMTRATINESYTKNDSNVYNRFSNAGYISFCYERPHPKKNWITTVLECGYAQKGVAKTFDSTKTALNPLYSGHLSYLFVLPQAKFFYKRKDWSFYALFGGRFDYRIGIKTDDPTIEASVKKYVEDNFNPMIVGLSYGAGITREWKGVRLGLEFQYHQDLMDLLFQDPPGMRYHAETYVFTTTLGIPLGKKKTDSSLDSE